jgi:hypothetical protein
MKRLMSVVSLLALSSVALASPIFNASNGHYYEYVSAPGISWHDARITAETYSLTDGTDVYQGFLAVPDDAAENDFLGTVTGADYVWLGLTDEASEGTWLISSGPDAGSAANYLNWASGEPNNVQYANINGVRNGEHYAERYTTGVWNDLPYAFPGRTTGYFVEFTTSGTISNPTVSVPAPATTSLLIVMSLMALFQRRRLKPAPSQFHRC